MDRARIYGYKTREDPRQGACTPTFAVDFNVNMSNNISILPISHPLFLKFLDPSLLQVFKHKRSHRIAAVHLLFM